MTDFVEILENYCIANSIQFEYGRQASLNLLESGLDKNKTYCLLDPVKRESIRTRTNGKVIGTQFSGYFMLLKLETMDMPYYTEGKNNKSRSKYIINIKPLLDWSVKMQNEFGCKGFTINKFEAIDAVDVLDANRDGILVTYELNHYE